MATPGSNSTIISDKSGQILDFIPEHPYFLCLWLDEVYKEVPIYEYHCDACDERVEKIQKHSEPPLKTCPSCGEDMLRKLVSAAAFKLKGTGWYETDFKDKPKDKESSKSKTTDSTATKKSNDNKNDASTSSNTTPESKSDSSKSTGSATETTTASKSD